MAKTSKPALKAVKRPVETTADVPEPVKVNLYDGGAMKNGLDEYVREVVIQAGLEEDVTTSNLKILFGLTAIGFALYAQFGPGKFPDTWWTVFGCVSIYFIITCSVSIYSMLWEGSSFLITKLSTAHPYTIRLSSTFNRLEHEYAVTFESGSEAAGNMIQVEYKIDVAQYFHSDGFLAEVALREKMVSFLSEYLEAVKAGDSKKSK